MTRPLRLLTIIGARPQIIKAAALGRAIQNVFPDRIKETLLHTGQHYDAGMSQVFFEELGIAAPDIQLGTGSGSHGTQTARMLEGIEQALESQRPDAVVVYGDTNSTLAGALAASKMNIAVAHIEAGLRSFNKRMPEEINRITSDHCSTWLFCPTRTAVDNLEKEGFDVRWNGPPDMDHPRVVLSGDVMFDNSLHFAGLARQRSGLMDELGLKADGFFLATLHRAANTDDPIRLAAILETLLQLGREHDLPVVLPMHPRTRARLAGEQPGLERSLQAERSFHIIPPIGFLDMTLLESHARIVLTDSGGVQKEAAFFGRPCVILREETEWTELVENGMAIPADADPIRIRAATSHFLNGITGTVEGLFGDGHAAEHICEELLASRT
jgi:UDP-GlcNAc3NAcA epimerase